MIEVTVTGTQEVVARIQGMSQKVRAELVKSMRQQWLGLQTYVVQNKLSGQVLKRVTGNLASSINAGGANTASEFIDNGTGDIIGRVGTKVVYAAVHEYGGTVQVPAHERRITQAFGKPIEPTTAFVQAHDAVYPERSFLRSSLEETKGQIRDNIAAAIKDFLS